MGQALVANVARKAEINPNVQVVHKEDARVGQRIVRVRLFNDIKANGHF